MSINRLNRHFVIGYKNLCSSHKPSCISEAKMWAKVALVLQTMPQICDPNWRQMNPAFGIKYMGENMTFQSESLFKEIQAHGRPRCLCVNSLILRSNDGVNPEEDYIVMNPDDRT